MSLYNNGLRYSLFCNDCKAEFKQVHYNPNVLRDLGTVAGWITRAHGTEYDSCPKCLSKHKEFRQRTKEDYQALMRAYYAKICQYQ